MREKMLDRGATEGEVVAAIRAGNSEPGRKGRVILRKNSPYNDQWQGKRYAVKQVAAVVSEEAEQLVVVTVFVYYF
jgi:hypothetical protein